VIAQHAVDPAAR
jgi:hypothetical protein